jgi:crossover junction endodeoxyribonuclease RuvC
MTGVIVGVDPGITGALAFYRPGAGFLEVCDMPTLELMRNGKKKRAINAYELARLIDDKTRADSTIAWVEAVGAQPTDGAVQAFQFGQSTGLIVGVLAGQFIHTERVAPVSWRRAMGIKAGSGKDISRATATKLFPRYAEHFARVKHEGRAEAALIAVYGAQQGALK